MASFLFSIPPSFSVFIPPPHPVSNFPGPECCSDCLLPFHSVTGQKIWQSSKSLVALHQGTKWIKIWLGSTVGNDCWQGQRVHFVKIWCGKSSQSGCAYTINTKRGGDRPRPSDAANELTLLICTTASTKVLMKIKTVKSKVISLVYSDYIYHRRACGSTLYASCVSASPHIYCSASFTCAVIRLSQPAHLSLWIGTPVRLTDESFPLSGDTLRGGANFCASVRRQSCVAPWWATGPRHLIDWRTNTRRWLRNTAGTET